MKHSHFKNLRLIAFGLIFVIGMSYAYAAWNNPAMTAPSGNIDIPVNTGDRNSQDKAAGLSVERFLAAGNAQFDQQVFVPQMVRGGNYGDATSTVSFGGQGLLTTTYVSIDANGNISAHDTLRSGLLANTTQHQLCADSAGTIILCP